MATNPPNTLEKHHMAKNQSSQSPSRTSCERIRKATIFGRFRRVATASTSPMPPPCVSQTQPTTLPQPALSNEIPIEYGPPPVVKPVRNVRFSSENVKKNDNGNGGGGRGALADQKTFGESRFESFIDRTKKKLGAPSNVGGGKKMNRHDTFNEKVSNFINRTKFKLRATSSVVGANGK